MINKLTTKNLIGITFKNLGSCMVHHPNQIRQKKKVVFTVTCLEKMGR